MAFQKFDNFAQLKAAGIEYLIDFGRRQPMHQAHWQRIRDGFDNGFKPIIVVGSTNTVRKNNGLYDPFFEPLANPLNYEQQKQQIKLAFPDKILGRDYFVFEMKDIGNNQKWYETLVENIKGQLEIDGRYPDLSAKTAIIFTGKVEDKRPRRLVTGKEVLSYSWEGILDDMGIPVLEMPAYKHIDLELSSRNLRPLDLNNLTVTQRALFATPDYIRDLANQARKRNGLNADVPVTMLDLSLERLKEEKSIGIGAIALRAKHLNPQPVLADYVEAARQLNNSITKVNTLPLNIMTGHPNQTVYDSATNIPNLVELGRLAAKNKVDILLTPELSATGYTAGDYHQFPKNNDVVFSDLMHLAREYNALDPDLIVSVGAPWHYSNKELEASDERYNIGNKPYNAQFFLMGGKIIAASAKSILAVGPAEYENHQFKNWPAGRETIQMTLPNGDVIPFGKPIIAVQKNGERVTIVHEQCAEGWPGVNDDYTIVAREQNQARLIATLSKTDDLSIVLNPSASKPQPAINKSKIRQSLCTSGSKFAGVLVYAATLGSDSGIHATEGDSYFAQDGKIIHSGQRYSFKKLNYNIKTVDVPLATKGLPDVVIERDFKPREQLTVGAAADFEIAKDDLNALAHEEFMRSLALHRRDYLSKQAWPAQGYAISLSGGKDSAYGALVDHYMVELTVKEEGIEGFFNWFPDMKYKSQALEVYNNEGKEAAIKFIKSKMFLYVYSATDNSSFTTYHGAQVLIEGGVLPDGAKVEGIGGKFIGCNIQEVLDAYLVAHARLDLPKAIADMKADPAFAKEIVDINALAASNPKLQNLLETWAKSTINDQIKQYVNAAPDSNAKLPKYIADNCQDEIPTWSDPKRFDIVMQNYQARARVPLFWAKANQESKIATATSNASESAIGYTTAAGDMHLGGVNPIGGVPKPQISDSLEYFRVNGLIGTKPVQALHYITVQTPTAELRKQVEGQAPQTDEGDLGFTYPQEEVLQRRLVTDRQSPLYVFNALVAASNNLFPNDAIETRKIIVRFAQRWEAGQFKRVMGPIAPFVGDNLDPHESVRTPILGDHFKTGIAHLTLGMLADKHGGQEKLSNKIGIPFFELKGMVQRDSNSKKQLGRVNCEILEMDAEALRSSWMVKEWQREYQRIQGLNLKLVA